MQVFRTGYKANDAYSAYIEMGKPKALSPAQLNQLRDMTRDLPELEKTIIVGASGTTSVNPPMKTNDIALIKLSPKLN